VRIYGLIGGKLDHSWSKQYFEEKFSRLSLTDCSYRNFPMRDISELPGLLRDNKEIIGLNVTIPFKQAVIRLIDHLDQDARETGAVNCIKVLKTGGKTILEGFNTDTRAFELSLRPMLTVKIRKALVLGTGGASRAVCQALKRLSIDHSMVSRDPSAGNYTYNDLTPGILACHHLIINATPAGMAGDFEQEELKVPYDGISVDHIIYDLIYNPDMTTFLNEGASRGARIKNGYEMLTTQADLSWEIWSA
jgi:shikimate dehydrogenase